MKRLEFYIPQVSKYPVILGMVSSFTYLVHTVYTHIQYTFFTCRGSYVKSCNIIFWGILWFGLMCFTVKWQVKNPEYLKKESVSVTLWKGLMVAAKKFIPVILQGFKYFKVINWDEISHRKGWGWWSATSYCDGKLIGNVL